MSKNRYVQEREFERQSHIRLRGQLWYQTLIFVLETAVAMGFTLVVGMLCNVVWYLLRCGANVFLGLNNRPLLQPTWSTDYLVALVQQSVTGQTLLTNNLVITLVMLLVFAFLTVKNGQRWWDWTQLYSDRRRSLVRFATSKEIDQTYKLIPDRNAPYAGNGGLPIAHISGYSWQFAKLHPLKWLLQLMRAPFGINREVWPAWYQTKINQKAHAKPPFLVTGGYTGFYWIDDQPTHEEILGATRAGKDQRYGYISIDILRRAEFKPNIIDTDAKNEDAKMSYKPLRQAGYDVQLLNIADVDWSESWNPLETALSYAQDGEWDKARDEATTVVQILGTAGAENSDGIWEKTAQDLQLAVILILLWLAIEHDDPSLVTPASIIQFVNSMTAFSDPNNDNQDGLTRYLDMLSKLDPMPPIINQALNSAGSYRSSSGDTKTSIMFTFQSMSRLFTSETIARLTSQSTIHVSDYGFSRLIKWHFDPVIYAGTSALVSLIDVASNEMIEEDALKVSRSGVIKYPFKNNFPDHWEMRVTFADTANATHLRDSQASVFGIKRQKVQLNGQLKVDPYSKQPEIEVVMESKASELFNKSSFSYELRYSEKPAAVFIIIPQNNDNYASLGSLFLGQVFSMNTEIASEITRRKMDRRTIYKLNEFSIWPRIPGFDSFLTRGLTYGHIVNAYVQDHTQYEKKYSAQEAKEIQNQMLLSVYIQSKDQTTNEELSKQLGEIEVQKEAANFQSGNERLNKGNIQASVEKKPLMSTKDIAELLDGEMIILRTAKRLDHRFRKVRAHPVFDTQATTMPNSRDIIGKSYSLDYYTTDLRLKNKNSHLAYDDLFKDFSPYFNDLAEKVTPTQANDKQETSPSQEATIPQDVLEDGGLTENEVTANDQIISHFQPATILDTTTWINLFTMTDENKNQPFFRKDYANNDEKLAYQRLLHQFLQDQYQDGMVGKQAQAFDATSEYRATFLDDHAAANHLQTMLDLFNGDTTVFGQFYQLLADNQLSQYVIQFQATSELPV